LRAAAAAATHRTSFSIQPSCSTTGRGEPRGVSKTRRRSASSVPEPRASSCSMLEDSKLKPT
jgi:hypothetical protein